MKKSILLLLVLAFALPIFAIKYPCQKELKKKNFSAAQQEIERLLASDPNDVTANFAAYILYSDSTWTGFKPEQGYEYLLASQTALAKDKANKAKLEKAGFDKDLFKENYARVGEMLWTKYARINTIEAYESFLNTYKKLPGTIKSRANKALYKLAYDRAIDLNTAEAFTQYIAAYPKSSYIKSAEERRNLLLAGNDWRKCRTILETAKDRDVKELSKNALFQALKNSENVEGLRYACGLPDTWLRDSCIVLLHHLYTETYDVANLNQFYMDVQISGSAIYDAFMEKDAQAVSLYNSYLRTKSPAELEHFIAAAAPYYMAFIRLQWLIDEDVDNRQWQKALNTVLKFDKVFNGESRYEQLKQILAANEDTSVAPQLLPKEINSPEGAEYVPLISGDGNTIMFCAQHRKDSIGAGEDIYVAHKINGKWQNAKPVEELCRPGTSESPLSLSVDGNSLILFKSGKIYSSEKSQEGWTTPVRMSDNINFCTWQADACLSSDGRALLFAARELTERELNLKDLKELTQAECFKRTNIYVSLRREDGSWGIPIELGKTINTPLCDRAPFLHPDMKTLYFCSEGHGGLGELDVYRSQRLNDDSWTEWSEPVNLGKEINTIGDDCWYTISTDGQKAFYSTNGSSDKEDIFQLNLPTHLQPDKVATIEGVLTDKDGKPLDAEIIWEDLILHREVGHSRSNPVDGSFFIVLPKGKIYGYYIDKEGFFPIADNIDLREVQDMVEMKHDITVVTYQQMIEENIPMPLNNIFFPTAKAILLPESESELRRVAQIIQRINGHVEISGHTDNVGNDDANQILSEQRAKAVYDFLINEGCNPDSLKWIGYGESKPVADNSTEKGRQQNRRVELRFIKF